MSDGETMRTVVLGGQSNPYAAKVTAAILHALEVGVDAGDAHTAGDAPSDDAGRTDEVLNGPRRVPLEEPTDEALCQADVAVVFEPDSLARAVAAGVGLTVVVFPSLDLSWDGDLAEAGRVVVAHEDLIQAAVRRGAARGRVDVVGLVAPMGFEPPADRRKVRQELIGDDAKGGVVLISAAAFEEHGAQAVMVQLALVRAGTTFLFDVGRDPDAADAVRRLAPLYGLRGWLFAEEPVCERYWQLADVVVGRSRGHEVNRSLAVGAPLVLLPRGPSDALAVRILEGLGVGSDAEVLATLAVAIDRALEEDSLADTRRDIARLEISETAPRIAVALRTAWEAFRGTSPEHPRGLPQGLEALSGDEADGTPRGPLPGPNHDDLEGSIERELAALKRRLGAE